MFLITLEPDDERQGFVDLPEYQGTDHSKNNAQTIIYWKIENFLLISFEMDEIQGNKNRDQKKDQSQNGIF